MHYGFGKLANFHYVHLYYKHNQLGMHNGIQFMLDWPFVQEMEKFIFGQEKDAHVLIFQVPALMYKTLNGIVMVSPCY